MQFLNSSSKLSLHEGLSRFLRHLKFKPGWSEMTLRRLLHAWLLIVLLCCSPRTHHLSVNINGKADGSMPTRYCTGKSQNRSAVWSSVFCFVNHRHLLSSLMPAGRKGVHYRGTGLGESAGLFLVAWDGRALEDQVLTSWHTKGGVVWRWDVFRGKKTTVCSTN